MVPPRGYEDRLPGPLQNLKPRGALQAGELVRVGVAAANIGCQFLTVPKTKNKTCKSRKIENAHAKWRGAGRRELGGEGTDGILWELQARMRGRQKYIDRAGWREGGREGGRGGGKGERERDRETERSKSR